MEIKNKAKMPVPTEFAECLDLVRYLELFNYTYTHTAQETFTKYKSVLRKNKEMGVKKGLPDYIIILKNFRLLFLEMKRVKGSKTSPEQLNWIEQLNNVENVFACVAHGADEAINIIRKLEK